MRRNMRLAVLVLLLMTLFLSGCGKPKEEPAAAVPEQQGLAEVPAESFELKGDYVIDITNLGMALQFYLRINEDNTFILAPNRQFTSDRGSGRIGELEGTFMMIYSDSTPERSKTATFEREGHNLVFRSTLPYGSANIMFELEDEESPGLIHRLMAHKYVYEEYYDTYLAFVTQDGVDYEYVLNLKPGALYTYTCTGPDEVYSENGTFRVLDDKIWLTPQGEGELAGSINSEGALELLARPTAQAEREAVLFRAALTAEYAGTWYGSQVGVEASLELDYFGGYQFTAGEYSESGSFALSQGSITFTPEGGEAREAKWTPYNLETSFNGQSWTLYNEEVQGLFAGGTMVNENYRAELSLNSDGSFSLVILDQAQEGLELLKSEGFFTITPGPMAYRVNLEGEGFTSAGDIWPTGLNLTFNVEGSDCSFLLTK